MVSGQFSMPHSSIEYSGLQSLFVTHFFLFLCEQFEAEFRRYGLAVGHLPTFDEFVDLVMQIHKLHGLLFTIWYTDPEGDLLPLSNNENFAKALTTAQPLLRVIVLRKGSKVSLCAKC